MQYKNPLRVAQGRQERRTAAPPIEVPPTPREATMREYELYLRSTTNRHGRPYAPTTVSNYLKSVRMLDKYLTGQGEQADFPEVCDTQTLNAYYREYWLKHDAPRGDGVTSGARSAQKNQRVFFRWLAEETDGLDPFEDPKLRRYADSEPTRNRTLTAEFIRDVLRTTEGRTFAQLRDCAILSALTEGLRSEELLRMTLGDVERLAEGVIHVEGLKAARGTNGRWVPIQPKTALALRRYMRARREHPRAEETASLWLGTRGQKPIGYHGLYFMLKRRVKEAGYDPSLVSAHSFRHTTAGDLLEAGVSGDDVMTAMGWKDPAMLRRYGSDMAQDRAAHAIHRLGDRF